MILFSFLGNPANLQNGEAQTQNKRIVTLKRVSWALFHPGGRKSPAVLCSPENGIRCNGPSNTNNYFKKNRFY
jgi:hypothetical protein